MPEGNQVDADRAANVAAARAKAKNPNNNEAAYQRERSRIIARYGASDPRATAALAALAAKRTTAIAEGRWTTA